MKIFFLLLIFILSVFLLEVSFLDILFPLLSAPLVILLVIVNWALLLPFPAVLFRTLPLAILFDIAIVSPGTLTLYSLLLVYVTGFLTRRFLADHHSSFVFLFILFAFMSTLGFSLFAFFFSSGMSFFSSDNKTALFSLFLSSQHIVLTFFLCIPLFIICSYAVKRFHLYIQLVDGAASRNIR